MATKHNKFCNTGKSPKNGGSLDLVSRKSYYERMKELKLLPPRLYKEMHDILMLLVMLNGKYDVVRYWTSL